MHIRPARLDDFEALCGLWEALDERHRRARPDLFRVPPGERREREAVRERIEGPESTILVAEVGTGGLLGFCAALVQHRPATPVREERRLVEVDELVVRPDERRRGVASALLDAALAWAREQPGVTSVELNVWNFNDEARAFYEAQGFETLVRRMGLPLTRLKPRRPCPSPVPPSAPGDPGQGFGAGTGAGLGGWRARWRAWRQGGGAGRRRGNVAGQAHPPGGVRTERCVLDRLSEADRRWLVRLLADPRVRRHLGGPKPEAQIPRTVDGYLARSAGGGWLWAVRAAEDRALLGLLFLGEHHDGADVEVSYLFAPERWGRGFATEAVAGLLAHATRTLGLRRVVAETQAANGASRRVLEKLGMQPERRVVRFGEAQVIYFLDLG